MNLALASRRIVAGVSWNTHHVPLSNISCNKSVHVELNRVGSAIASHSHMTHSNTPGEPANLTQHRSETSVWDRRGWNGGRDRHDVVRLLVGAGGGALMIQGMRMRSRVRIFTRAMPGKAMPPARRMTESGR